MYTGFSLGTLRERDHLEVLGIDRKIILKLILKYYGTACTGVVSFKLGTSVGLL